MRLASESRFDPGRRSRFEYHPKLLYKWQHYALLALLTDLSDATEVRQLRAANERLAQELEILKKPLPFSAPRRLREPLPVH